MSGTSLDGIDVALVKFNSQSDIQLVASQTYAIEDDLRNELTLLLSDGAHSFSFIGDSTQRLTLAYSNAVNDFLKQQSLSPKAITAIGCHGQTVWHAPDATTPFSIQLHNPALLAVSTGINVIDNFRAKDLALGGQGAPLVPPFHAALLMPYPNDVAQRIIINIGGIANVTVLPASFASNDLLDSDGFLDNYETLASEIRTDITYKDIVKTVKDKDDNETERLITILGGKNSHVVNNKTW
ncbi:MAG: anhydro-N-acetylmuramic acid kinase, partial [Glaciecola sp.]